MIRYTKRERCLPKVDTNGTEHWVEYIEVSDKKAAEEKLCQLEDIEDELSIDLVTLSKALKNGIYHITSNKNVVGYLNVKWAWCIGRNYFKTKYGNFYFKDYGKTWALTKEELE